MGKFDSAETPFRNGFTSLDQAGKHVEGAGAFNMILKTSIPGSQRHIETVSPWPQQQRRHIAREASGFALGQTVRIRRVGRIE